MRHILTGVVALAIALSTFGTAFASSGNASVYVIHGIPGRDISPAIDPALPVDVSVNGACALTDFKFGQTVGPLSLSAGSYAIAISLADNDPATGCNSAPVIGPAHFYFHNRENATVIAHLTEGGAPTATKFTNDVRRLGENRARLAVRHTANAPKVDIGLYRGDREVGHLTGLYNPYELKTTVRAGDYSAAIFPAGGLSPVFGPVPLSLAARNLTIVYAVGSLANGTFTVLPQVIATR
jgi:hypothetical protein